jgi:hypothetical protein
MFATAPGALFDCEHCNARVLAGAKRRRTKHLRALDDRIGTGDILREAWRRVRKNRR